MFWGSFRKLRDLKSPSCPVCLLSDLTWVKGGNQKILVIFLGASMLLCVIQESIPVQNHDARVFQCEYPKDHLKAMQTYLISTPTFSVVIGQVFKLGHGKWTNYSTVGVA